MTQATTLRAFVQEAFTLGYDANDLDAYMTRFAPDCEIMLPGTTLHGREQWKAFLTVYAQAFSESRHDVVAAVESDSAIASEVVWRGKHTGALMTPTRELPPSGRTVTWSMCMVDRFQAGRIASRHVYYDQLELMAQLDPAPTAP